MDINIFFLKTKKGFSQEQEKKIEDVILEHSEKAGKTLNITSPVNITIYASSQLVIPETGDGGYTPSSDWIQVSIDPERPLEEILEKHLPGTIYHEMNHVARWNTTGYGKSLLDAIVMEGLGTVFEKEMWLQGNPLWGEYSEEGILEYLKNRDKEEDAYYSHDEWFFGTGEYPRWIGYKIGTYIVEQALKYNPELKSADLVAKKTEEIIKLSRLDI